MLIIFPQLYPNILVSYEELYYLPCKTLNMLVVFFFVCVCAMHMLANALIFPYFDYCSPVWSNCNLKSSNTIQILENKLAHALLSADIRNPVDYLSCDLNWIKLDKRWKSNLFGLYLSVSKMLLPLIFHFNLFLLLQ